MTTTAVEFDPFSDEYFDDPTEVYRRLRDEAPVYFSERYGFYALSRFADVVAAHRDWQGFSSAHGVDLSTLSRDEASQQCVGATADSIERYGSELGLEVVYTNDDLAFGLPNGVGPEVTAMQDAGADGVYGCIDLNGMKTFASELERQGMADVPMVHPNTYDENFVAEAGELFEGDTVTVGFRPFQAEPEGSALADFLEWMEETGSEITEPAMVGWINADLAYQGIQAAGEDFDRQKVIDATNELTEFTAGGLIAPIDWSRQHTAPTEDDRETHGSRYECVAMVHVTGGEFQLVGESERPWYCWDGADRSWSEPEQMNFE